MRLDQQNGHKHSLSIKPRCETTLENDSACFMPGSSCPKCAAASSATTANRDLRPGPTNPACAECSCSSKLLRAAGCVQDLHKIPALTRYRLNLPFAELADNDRRSSRGGNPSDC